MISERRVVVKGGGKNLYRVSESGGWFYVYKIDVGILSSNKHNIGKTRSLDDALALVRSHSGREIESVD